ENPPSQLPLSFSQQRLWLIDQLEGGSSHYNMPVALQVDGMFDVVAAEKALNTILARHEVLRTVYKQAGETVYQEVQTDVSVPFSMHDLQGMKMQSQREAIQSKLTEDARAHFDLSTDVMLRGSWLQQSATQGVLLFNIHHIASDGWSMSVLVDEFNQLYQAYAQGMDNPLAGLTLQYSDYALWQQEELVG
ncbi:condensation domain-containing protein, partial [Pseudoalteromonas sp. 2CM41L]|uniref:condensation domain-containing protein n=1 Tax=Pseudoalteromonas sp. 2CM41L TaxID=2929857 RepID=UPI0020C0F665